MSVEIKNNKITMTRGDTLRTRVRPYIVERDEEGREISRQEYIPQSGDSLSFAVKHTTMKGGKQYKDPEPLILKDIPIATCLLQLDPADTKPLDFETYVYDVEIIYADGTVYTFIDTEDFILTPEVHGYGAYGWRTRAA